MINPDRTTEHPRSPQNCITFWILDEQFNPDRPNAVWCSDITYIWTVDGFVYLTSIMDLYSRKIIAWTLSDSMEVSCVIDTVNKAKARRNTDKPLILHSDYAEESYIIVRTSGNI